MRNFLRLLTGRIAFERQARLLAAELAWRHEKHDGYPRDMRAEQILVFLLSEEFPR